MTTGAGKSVETLEAEAAAWASKIDAAPGQDPAGLSAWCAQDPKHVGALLRAQAALALFHPVADIRDAPVEAKTAPTRKWLAVAGGAVAALAASVAAVFSFHAPTEQYQTAIGEVRTVALSDGSSVSIDAKSRIEIAYNTQNRDIRILSGKALFHAVHNGRRPFRVIVDNIVVTDLGTIFQVADDESSGQVDILVTEGAVRVDAPSGQVNLTTGQHARFSTLAIHATRPKPVRIAPADVDRMLAWRDGRLELDGETLDSAVADINRHSRLHLRVAGTRLGQESLYGSFRMDDAAGFARAAALSLGTEARTEPNGIVIGPEINPHPD